MIAEVPADPARIVILAGLAPTAKSWTVNVAEAECVSPLLVPVTVTAYEPATPAQANDDVTLEVVLLSARTEGLRLQFRPLEGETVTERATLPAKPSNPFTIIVVSGCHSKVLDRICYGGGCSVRTTGARNRHRVESRLTRAREGGNSG